MKKLLPLFYLGVLCGLPTNPTVCSGDVSFQNDTFQTEITVSEFAEIHWDDFSIGKNEIVHFLQPSKEALTINRVITETPSLLLGNLEGIGQVMLINQKGVLVGKDAYINLNSFIASTLDLVDKDSLLFAGKSTAPIVNEGTICAKNGDVVLLSQSVENIGNIQANQGSILLGAGKEILYQPDSKQRLFVRISSDENYDGIGIENTGNLSALHTELRADGNLYEYAIHHSGEIDAIGVKEVNGEIFLVAEEGLTEVDGSLRAEGGEIHVLGKRVGIDEEIRIDVSSDKGAGTVLIGGDYRGKNPEVINSEYTYVGKDVEILADSKKAGNGGKVIVWGGDVSAVYGNISATGGQQAGDGGFVEISSPKSLHPKGHVDTSAPFGKNGTLLLDPCAVMITNAATSLGVSNSVPPPQPLEYSFGALASANILVTEIAGFLATNDVTIDAASSGSGGPGTGSITFDAAPLTWGTPTKLTLIADNLISFLSNVENNAAGLSSSDVVLDLQAPLIEIGRSDFSRDGIGVSVLSGKMMANFSNRFSIYGGNVGGGLRNTLSGSYFEFTGGDLQLMASTISDSEALVSLAGGEFVANLTGDVLIQAAGGQAGFAAGVSLSNINIAANNCSLIGGYGANVGSPAILVNFDGGDITLTLQGDLTAIGGTSTGAMGDGNAAISVQNASGDVNISARNITFLGGGTTDVVNKTSNFSGFLHTGSGVMDVVLTARETLTLSGGGLSGPAFFAAVDPLSNVTVRANAINITGGADEDSGARIGGGGNVTVNVTTDLNISTQAGGDLAGIAILGNSRELDLNVGGNISLNSSGPNALIGALPGTTDNVVNVGCRNLTSSNFSSGECLILIDGGTLNLEVLGGVSFQGGAAVAATPALSGILGGFSAGQVAELNIQGNSFSFNGGQADNCISGVVIGDYVTGSGGGNGVININATGPMGISLNGGNADNTPALLQTYGMGSGNAINFQASHLNGNVRLVGSSTAGLTNAGAEIRTLFEGAITDPSGGSIVLNGTSSGPAIISVGPGSPADLVLIAGINIELNSAFSSIENLSGGDLILVVDNDFPEPFVGPGAFISAAGSSVTTAGGGLRIFTARQAQNSVEGTLNALSFTPGPIFQDTATEVWSTYYPTLAGGFPYTIFYKDNLQLIAYQATLSSMEMLRMLTDAHYLYKDFNEYLGWPSRFVISYEIPEDLLLRLPDEPYILEFKNDKLVSH